MKDTMREVVIKYILLKIQSKSWEAYTKIPSAQRIANHFSCHLNTAKSAISHLLATSILYKENGRGCYVNPHSGLLFSSFRNKYKIKDIRHINLNNQEKILLDKNYGFFTKSKCIKKEYWKNNKLIAIIFSSMVHPIFDYYQEYPLMPSNSFPTYLSQLGVIVGTIQRSVSLKSDNFSVNLLKDFNLKNYVLKKTNIYDFDKVLIEKSISIIHPDYYEDFSFFTL